MKFFYALLSFLMVGNSLSQTTVDLDRLGIVKRSYDEEVRLMINSALGDLKQYDILIVCTDPFRQVVALRKNQTNKKLRLISSFWTPQLANTGAINTKHDEKDTEKANLLIEKIIRSANNPKNNILNPDMTAEIRHVESFYFFEKFLNGSIEDWRCYRVQSFPENTDLIALMNLLIPKEMIPNEIEINKFFQEQ